MILYLKQLAYNFFYPIFKKKNNLVIFFFIYNKKIFNSVNFKQKIYFIKKCEKNIYIYNFNFNNINSLNRK